MGLAAAPAEVVAGEGLAERAGGRGVRGTGGAGPWAAGIVFALLLALGLLHHEMWRDELQAWMLAKSSSTPGALLANMRYEGHPALWHLLLFPLAHAFESPVGMQVLHFAIAVAGVAAFLAWAPFPFALRALFAAGYLPLFEYGVISRNYALALPLLWMVCRLWPTAGAQRRWVALGGSVALLANANPYAWLLAAALLATLAFETWCDRAMRAEVVTAPARPWLGAAIAAAGLVLALWQMVPPPDALYAESAGWSAPRLYRVLGTVMTGYLPLPDWRTSTPWNSALLYRLPAPLLGGFAVAWLVTAWLLLDSRAARTLFLLGNGALLYFSYLRFIGWSRHHGHYFLVFVACCWLASRRREGGADPYRRLRLAALAVLLAVHAATAAWFYAADWRLPFSEAKAAATALASPPLAGLPAYGYPGPPLPAVGAYRGEVLSLLSTERPVPFVEWRRGGERLLGEAEICALLADTTRRHGGAVAFVAPPAAMPAACPGLVVQQVGGAPRPLVPSEQLATWRVALR